MILVWQIESDYAHFSHPATIYSSLSYPVPPKTAVMGMLGAIMGEDSDYTPLNSMKYSVVVTSLKGKKSFCFNGIKEPLSQLKPTNEEGFKKGRKQFYRELLLSPSYEIYCDISNVDSDFKDRLLSIFESGKAIYPLYLGVNFALASHKVLGVYPQIDSTIYDEVKIDSIIPLDSDFLLQNGGSYTDVRMATTVDEDRHFGGFRNYLVEMSAKGVVCKNIEASKIGDRVVVWS